jgi:hypothetical protein
MFMEWKNGAGLAEFYDKDTQTKIQIQGPIKMVLLDILSTAKGWDDANKASLIANEVHNPATEQMVVKSYYSENGQKKSLKLVEGFWKKDIKDKFPLLNFYQSIYGVMEYEGEVRLVNLKVSGSGLASIFDAKLRPADGFLVTFAKGEAQKQGKANWFSLVVSKETEVPANLDQRAADYYPILKAYLAQYKNKANETLAQEVVQDEAKLDLDRQVFEMEEPTVIMPF